MTGSNGTNPDQCPSRLLLVASAGIDVQCHREPHATGQHAHYVGAQVPGDWGDRAKVTWWDSSPGARADGMAGQAEML